MPLDQVGYMLKEVYQRGTGGFELTPLYKDRPAPNGQIAGKIAEVLEQLPAPKSKEPPSTNMPFRHWLYELVHAKAPIDRETIGAHAAAAFPKQPSIAVTAGLSHLKHLKYLTLANNVYRSGPKTPNFRRYAKYSNGAAQTTPAKEPNEGTQAGTLLAFLRRREGPVTYEDIKKEAVKKSIPIPSAATALLELRKKGFANRVGASLYQAAN